MILKVRAKGQVGVKSRLQLDSYSTSFSCIPVCVCECVSQLKNNFFYTTSLVNCTLMKLISRPIKMKGLKIYLLTAIKSCALLRPAKLDFWSSTLTTRRFYNFYRCIALSRSLTHTYSHSLSFILSLANLILPVLYKLVLLYSL